MNFTIIEFERRHKGDKGVDWVHYAGSATDMQYATNWSRVKDLEPAEGSKDAHILQRWEAVKSAYDMWLQGNEIPTHGTPLGAWPALSKSQLESFKAGGFRTVEEVAEMNDSQMGRVKLPDARGFRAMAQTFLSARDDNDVAERLEAQEAKIAELMAALEAKTEPKKRGPGRPPKSEAA